MKHGFISPPHVGPFSDTIEAPKPLPHQLGRAAYLAGQRSASCPYPAFSIRGREWMRGFVDAAEQNHARALRREASQ